MRLCFFTFLALSVLVLPLGPAQAQDTDVARKKCVEFGFKSNTTQHAECVLQFLQATGAGNSQSNPSVNSSAGMTAAQREEKFWDGAMAARNKEGFQAYLEIYPKGTYASLARANLARLNAPTEAPPVAASNTSGPKSPPLKIAFAYVGPVGDGGWTYAHDLGRRAIEKKFGDRVRVGFAENVPESADAERVIRDMATQGNKLIFGTTFGYMEPMLKVAPDFKDVKFEHATGFKQADNMRTYDSRTYEGAYMAGIIAGKMTKSNTLGVVAPIPIPEVIRNINSFTLGAQSVNPKVRTKVFWVNAWFDPPKETEAANALMNGGVDVLFQNTDSPAVLKAAEAKGKRAFGWDSDMTAYGPKAHLASAVINWGPYYIKATQEVLNGTWTGGGNVWMGVKEGAIDIVSIANDVPSETRVRVNDVKAGLRDGSYVIWKGPILDNNRRLQIGINAVVEDRFLQGMNFYVLGVEGKIPGGK